MPGRVTSATALEFQVQVVASLSRIQEQLKEQHSQVLASIESLHVAGGYDFGDKSVVQPSSNVSTPPSLLLVPNERAGFADKGVASSMQRTPENFQTRTSASSNLSFPSSVVLEPTSCIVEGCDDDQARASKVSFDEDAQASSSSVRLADFKAVELGLERVAVEREAESDRDLTGTRPAGMAGCLQPESTVLDETEATSGNQRRNSLSQSTRSSSLSTESSLDVETLVASSWALSDKNPFVLHECFDYVGADDRDSRYSRGTPKFEWSITVSLYPERDLPQGMRVGDAMMHSGGLWRFFVVRPNSISRIAWDLLGSVLILYDLIVLPLQAFPLSNKAYKDFQFIMAIIISCVWSLDIVWSLRTGIYVDGLMELRPAKIMRRYLKSGFPFDVLIVVLDWSFVIALIGTRNGNDSEGSGSFTFGKWMRILRLSRLVRLVKLIRVSRNIYDSLTSELVLAVLQIMKLVLVIVFLCHYVACAWYALGSIDETDNRWVAVYKIEETSMAYQYLTSLHWSLTQFTPASMEIYPRNEMERLFNIGALVFGLITFSSFISSLTAAMAHLASVRGHRLREETQLRQFLSERKISLDLGMNIKRYFSDNYEGRKNRVNEIDIEFFLDLPPFLLADLHAEIYMPIFCWHPLFKCYNVFDYESARKICHFASEQRNELQRHNVFLNGTVATEMLFVNTGELIYHCSLDGEQYRCTSGQWLCEPALWGSWTHRGRLSVQVSGDLVSLKGSTFCSIASEELKSFHSLRIYARSFVTYIVEDGVAGRTVTDMQLNIDVLHDMVTKAFGRTSRTSVRWGEAWSGDPRSYLGSADLRSYLRALGGNTGSARSSARSGRSSTRSPRSSAGSL